MKKVLWQPPRLRIGEGSLEERHATWLELFYDLVFVVAVAELGHNLNRDVSVSGFLGFVVLFVPVWWSWVGTAFYATRFDTDDLGYRLLTVVQMATVAALAVNIHGGLGETSAGFALSYAAVRTVLVLKYLRAIRHVVVARPLTTRFALGFAIAALLWLTSAFVPVPLRFGLWGLGLIVDFATPLSAGNLHADLAPHSSHLPERFGLFTLIVLGESVIAVVNGVAHQHWHVSSVISAVFGLSLAFSLWWVYFESADGSAIQCAQVARKIGNYQIWLYAHLPLVIGLTATGVGVEHVVSSDPSTALPDGARWLLCGAVALCLLALELIHLTTLTTGTKLHSFEAAYRIGAAIFVLVLAVAGAGLLPTVLMGLVAIACAIQIILELLSTKLA